MFGFFVDEARILFSQFENMRDAKATKKRGRINSVWVILRRFVNDVLVLPVMDCRPLTFLSEDLCCLTDHFVDIHEPKDIIGAR